MPTSLTALTGAVSSLRVIFNSADLLNPILWMLFGDKDEALWRIDPNSKCFVARLLEPGDTDLDALLEQGWTISNVFDDLLLAAVAWHADLSDADCRNLLYGTEPSWQLQQQPLTPRGCDVTWGPSEDRHYYLTLRTAWVPIQQM